MKLLMARRDYFINSHLGESLVCKSHYVGAYVPYYSMRSIINLNILEGQKRWDGGNSEPVQVWDF